MTFRAILIATAAALVVGASAAPVQMMRVGKPVPPGFEAYPVQIKCPGKIVADVTPAYVPSGWNSIGISLVFRGIRLTTFQGQQTLVCEYKTQGPNGQDSAAALRHEVPPGSCIAGPDNAWFQCKPGTK